MSDKSIPRVSDHFAECYARKVAIAELKRVEKTLKKVEIKEAENE